MRSTPPLLQPPPPWSGRVATHHCPRPRPHHRSGVFDATLVIYGLPRPRRKTTTIVCGIKLTTTRKKKYYSHQPILIITRTNSRYDDDGVLRVRCSLGMLVVQRVDRPISIRTTPTPSPVAIAVAVAASFCSIDTICCVMMLTASWHGWCREKPWRKRMWHRHPHH